MKDEYNVIEKTIKELIEKGSSKHIYRSLNHHTQMPSVEVLEDCIKMVKSIVFPGYFSESIINEGNLQYYLGVNLEILLHKMRDQIKRGLCFACNAEENEKCINCEAEATLMAKTFISRIPAIRNALATDVKANFDNDPAAKGYDEIIYCYPAIKALLNYRVAHELLKLGVPIIPRIITELAHSETGIDIHPGAIIGDHCAIDHGTGVVIGETCIIGNNVKIYQGVTLGAKSFPLDKNGKPIKGVPRHPIVEDNAIIYARATILGRITIGEGAIIGGNLWIVEDVPPKSRISQGKYKSKSV